MKIIYLFVILTILISACSSNNNKSDAYGNFEATEIIVSSEANGKILSFTVEEGELLKANEIVGLIDTVKLNLQKQQILDKQKAIASKLEVVSAQIEVQKQQKANLMIDKNRLEKLFKDEAATQQQMDKINGSLDLIEKQILSVKTQKAGIYDEIQALGKQIDQIDESLKNCYIKNPISGTVLSKFVEQSEITAFGKPLYKIANLTELKLKVYVSGAQLPNIKIGQTVEVLIDKNEKSDSKLNGEVCWISTSAEFTPKIIQTKKERVNLVYAVKVRVKNDGTLKIGMPGEINLLKK
ncbi:MAG: HlyD family efflux transporter periplasmic adaptor subunit [Bacteroidales bacterium]|nr:HlyD family efflux transporter periplasmic adaptor subunit [Bacteroidales bacterium]